MDLIKKPCLSRKGEKVTSFFLLFLFFLPLQAQAELPHRAKVWITQIVGAGVGGALGAYFTRKDPDEDRFLSGVFWSVAGAGILGVIGELIFDGDREIKELKRQLQVVKEELWRYDQEHHSSVLGREMNPLKK